MVTWFGWGMIIEKFASTFTESGKITSTRLLIWRDSLDIIQDFFLTGTGFGTFFHIYPIYKTILTGYYFDHVHNDYLELLTDGGVIGFTLAAWFVLSILAHGWKTMKFRRDRYAILLSIGAFTSIIAILFHSVVDFNMHNGANGLYFFFMCGLLVSAGNTRLYYRTRPTLLDKASSNSTLVLLVVSLIFMAMTIVIRGGAMFANAEYSQIANVYLNKNLRKEKILTVASVAQRAATFDPLEGKYSFALGNAQFFLQQPEDALGSFFHASSKDPLSGIYLQRLALMLPEANKDIAEKLMRLSYDRALNKTPLILTWAEWLLSTNDREKAIAILYRVFSDRPGFIKKFMPLLASHSFTRQELSTILPRSVYAWATYGDLLEKQGNIDDAEFFREGALFFLDEEEVIEPWYFSQLYWFYYRQKKSEKMTAVLRKAVERLPEHAEFHVLLGDFYKTQGIYYRAKEEYKQSLLLEPADNKTRKKLMELEER